MCSVDNDSSTVEALSVASSSRYWPISNSCCLQQPRWWYRGRLPCRRARQPTRYLQSHWKSRLLATWGQGHGFLPVCVLGDPYFRHQVEVSPSSEYKHIDKKPDTSLSCLTQNKFESLFAITPQVRTQHNRPEILPQGTSAAIFEPLHPICAMHSSGNSHQFFSQSLARFHHTRTKGNPFLHIES